MHDSLPARRWDSILPSLKSWLGARESLESLTDRQLTERSGLGDSRAFGVLYQRHVADVYRYVKLRVGDTALAEDLTQDVFISAFNAMPLFQWQGPIRPWFLRCAHNRIANHWRSVQRSPRLADLPDFDGEATPPLLPDPGDAWQGLVDRLSIERVLKAMDQLTGLRREVLALRFGAELSVAETAAWMGRTESAVKNLQFAALSAIRSFLHEEEGGA